jgi:hypothetical protein
MDDVDLVAAEKLQSLVAAAVNSIRIIEKVAEEMLLCEVSQLQHMPKA